MGFFLHTGLYSLYKFLLHAPCRLCFCGEFLLHAWLMENQKQTVIKSNCIILNNQLICLLFLLFHVFVWLFFSVCLFYTSHLKKSAKLKQLDSQLRMNQTFKTLHTFSIFILSQVKEKMWANQFIKFNGTE